MTSRSLPRPDGFYLSFAIDQFPAQAFAAYHPPYQARPFVVVRQDPESHKSSVWACSGPARALGVRPGTAVHMVERTHPDVEVVPFSDIWEQTAQADLSRIVYTYTPDVAFGESGICLMDLSHMPLLRRLDPEHVAGKLKEEIALKVNILEVACGVSRNRLLAKLLADLAKPDGVTVCPPGEEDEMLGALDVERLPGLSRATRDKIRKYGIRTVGQVRNLGREALMWRLGREGELLYSLSRGIDSVIEAPLKAVASETTLERDINDLEQLRQHVKLTADALCYKLQTQGLRAKRLTFILRYADDRRSQRTATFAFPVHEFTEIGDAAVQVFEEIYQRRIAIKSIRLVVKQPQVESGQLNLFETAAKKRQRRLDEAVTLVRDKMGFGSILSASYLEATGHPKASTQSPHEDEQRTFVEADFSPSRHN
ncbi:MAG: hypothetical protein QGI83_07610 [Candidatus Latescibacteria bacterium]|jgi:DNA polymerase-4|nr:hypothetical protein [Candidatus Latescibacterota bacterium]